MAKERLPMRKILEILRLRWEVGLTVRETAKALRVSTGSVSRTTERAKAAKLGLEAASKMAPEGLESLLYPGRAGVRSTFVEPNMGWIHSELRRVGVTLELLHMEYAAEFGSMALGYSAFCRRYRKWRKRRGPTLRKHYVGGEVLFVDFSGKRPSYVDPKSGEAVSAELFVAVLGASNLTYVEAVRTQQDAEADAEADERPPQRAPPRDLEGSAAEPSKPASAPPPHQVVYGSRDLIRDHPRLPRLAFPEEPRGHRRLEIDQRLPRLVEGRTESLPPISVVSPIALGQVQRHP